MASSLKDDPKVQAIVAKATAEVDKKHGKFHKASLKELKASVKDAFDFVLNEQTVAPGYAKLVKELRKQVMLQF